jgi:peptidoglycan/LPS O-acetylase OafA/YrhL
VGPLPDSEASTPEPSPAPPAAVVATGHFPCLDAYRGIGMLMVLASHASFATGYTGSTLGPYLSRFELAVPMFFMLSGFLLYRPEAIRALTGRAPQPTGRFLRRRGLRIFPGYWAAVVGIAVLFGAGVLADGWAWVTNLFVLQQFGSDEPLRITQAWSIGVELSFYVLLPLYVLATHRWARSSRRRLLWGCAGLVAVGWAFRLFVVIAEPSWQASSLNWLPMYLDFFGIGMALGVLSANSASGGSVPGPARLVGRHPVWAWSGAGAIFVLVAQMDPPAVPFGLNGAEYLPRQLAYSVASALWLGPAIFGDQSAGRLRAVLSSRLMTWLGAISLSFYLWHLELIGRAQRWTVAGYDDLTGLAVFSGNFWLVAAIATVTTLLAAAVVHRLVEVPFLLLKDRPLRELPATYVAALRRLPR